MNLSLSEKATIHFYQWDYRYRGYYHFDSPVDLEIPYNPFYSNYPTQDEISVDDGRVPGLIQSIGNLFSPQPKAKEVEEDIQELAPRYIPPEHTPIYVGFSLTFPKGQEIQASVNKAFLNMLSFTEHPITFEIIGNKDNIQIQWICSQQDCSRLQSHLKAYFPSVVIKEIKIESFGFNEHQDIAIADFGSNDEFVRPINTVENFTIDPLTSIIATMDSLQSDDLVVFQAIFKGVTSPLAKDIPYAVSDGSDGSFFVDAPEMPNCAKEKIANPLFSVVMRIATQGRDNYRSQYLAQELARGITSISTSQYNKLIPLSNEGYDYGFHKMNLHYRLSNRLGFVLNSTELNTFVHYPNKTVISQKLGLDDGKTKLLPKTAINQTYTIGVNTHNGIETSVSLNDQMRLRHTHIIGATGVGKSTLIANMIIEDLNAGNGCALFDPHGDIVEDILLRIPQHRKNDVIIIDPSDTDYPIGFNLLQAKTDIEKIVLSSDLVSAFKRHATAWGDNMTAVLSNAVNAFLESTKGGTLIELKRFLLEEKFRTSFLKTVDDASIHYYWQHEYPMVKKGIAPLLTRIDTFLRPKIVRYMLAQTKGIDFKSCIEEKKIVLLKLSQGLIGENNSYLLGSLFLSKFNQVAQGRQVLSQSQRHPYYIYLDEFQNFITPSIVSILSGARKYGLGLVLAHQELGQIEDTKILNSVISNPYTRICFRLGDNDAKKLESGFSYFEQNDLQSLGIGEAIIRIGSANDDFNIATSPLPETSEQSQDVRDIIIQNTRVSYCTPKAEVETILNNQLPKLKKVQPKIDNTTESENQNHTEDNLVISQKEDIKKEVEAASENQSKISPVNTNIEQEKEAHIQRVEKQETLRKHRSLQNYVRSLAIQRGFKATIEQETDNGGRVDIALIKDDIRIAIEISVTNTLDYEVKNIQKCIDSGYTNICMLSESMLHLKNIKKRASKTIDKTLIKRVNYLIPLEFTKYLDDFVNPKTTTKRVRGYQVKTNYNANKDMKQPSISHIIMKSLRKKK